MALVNALGKVTLDETNKETNDILYDILVELRVLNEHIARMRGEPLEAEDLPEEALR